MPYADPEKRRAAGRRHYRKNKARILANAWGKKHPAARREYCRKWYAETKAERTAYARARYAETKAERTAYARARYRKNKAKLSKQARARYAKYADQGKRYNAKTKHIRPTRPPPSVCECCGRLPGKKRLHLDHDHVTMEFRGWLCSQCNTGIGHLGDTSAGVAKALRYLEKRA